MNLLVSCYIDLGIAWYVVTWVLLLNSVRFKLTDLHKEMDIKWNGERMGAFESFVIAFITIAGLACVWPVMVWRTIQK